MKIDVIQHSFAGGEFGPSLFGRVDIQQYSNACEIVRNMLPRSYGPAISAPGSRYVATVSDSSLRTRLIPFVFNRLDSYVIEMGDKYMRFFTDRGQVIDPGGTDDVSAFTAKANWKLNDSNTATTVVIDAEGNHNGTSSTITSSLSTTAIVGDGFDLNGEDWVRVPDHADFTRTASGQPMTVYGWGYFESNGATQTFFEKEGEYALKVDSSDQMYFETVSGEANTILLMHFDEDPFTDSSTTGHSITTTGSVSRTTDESKFGGYSAFFDGYDTGTGVNVASHADFDIGSEDWTVDFWVNLKTLTGEPYLFFMEQSGSHNWWMKWHSTGGGRLDFDTIDASTNSVTFTCTTGNWYHFAWVRDGNTYRIFGNGQELDTWAAVGSDAITKSTLSIGNRNDAAGFNNIDGYIDEFRVVKGQAVWTSNFTVPADPYETAAFNRWRMDDNLTEGWHSYGVVFNGDGKTDSDCKLYLDGVIAETTFEENASYTAMTDTTGEFVIGSDSASSANNAWANKVDQICFLHDELTATQIATLYTESAYQITTVFSANEVFDIHYAQLNDVVWLAHPNHPVQKLTRTSANSWSIEDAPILGGPFLDDNTPVLTSTNVSASTIEITASATSGTVNITVSPTNSSLFTPSASTLGHQGSYWMIGGLSETDPTTENKVIGYVRLTDIINSYTATATVIKNLKTSSATDIWAEGAWSSIRGYPGKVAIQGNRLWFARTNHEPQKEWGSKVFDYENFALDEATDEDGINIALSSNESNEIQWLAAGKSLLAGTYGGVFITNSGGSDALTPDNVTATEEIGFGSEPIRPIKIGNYLYYIQRNGKKFRELFYNWELDTYKAIDRTILAPHILEDGVVDMGVQNNPETVMYCALTNGTMACLSREIDHEVSAWSKHTTDGTYTSVAVIPSQSYDYDEVWYVVERWVNGSQRKYVEFFENIEVPDRQDQCFYVHSGLTYNAYASSSTSNVTISLDATSGSITVTSSSAYFNQAMVDDGEKIRVIDEDGDTIGEGTITATTNTSSVTITSTTDFSTTSYNAGRWGVSVNTIFGLDHLEAKTLSILADGETESKTRTVASGKVTLGDSYFVITAGLSYDQIVYTLPKEMSMGRGVSNRGTAVGKWQRFNEITLNMNRSTQNFEYGIDADNLDDINLAFTPTVTSLYTGILPPQGGGIAMRGGFRRGDQIYLKNSEPLPIEILNIVGTLNTNDR